LPDCLNTETPCDPLIEAVLGLDRKSEIRDRSIAKIESINQRTPPPTWTAKATSLIDSSYAEVLAYKTGELPPEASDRNEPRNLAAKTKFLTSLAVNTWRTFPVRPVEWEVYSSRAYNQGVCSSCSAFAVSSAMESCVHRAGTSPGFSALPPRGVSQQHLLDCAFNSYGLAGCDGGRSYRYLQWLQGGGLESARSWPYVDGEKRWEVQGKKTMQEAFTKREGYGRCGFTTTPSVELRQALHSWDTHTEQDIENILLDGRAVVTTMDITPDIHHYRSGVYFSPECQNWLLGPGRAYQWEKNSTLSLRPLRHAVAIVGYGVDAQTGFKYWKVKNSWGELWGELGFLRISRIQGGRGHCGLGAFISVPLCGAYSGQTQPSTNTNPPTNLPEESVYFGQDPTLSSPLTEQGQMTCSTERCKDACPSNRPCKLPKKGGKEGVVCCRPLGGHGNRVYCPTNPKYCIA